MVESFSAGKRQIGPQHPPYVIAEMSANHAGSLERARDIVHAAAESGADAVKIQTYTPDTMTIDCDRKEFQLTEGTWEGRTLYDLYEEAHTPWEWHGPLKDEAEKAGVDFLSTAYEVTSADFLHELGVEVFKIASFECTHIPLLRHVASLDRPIILSTGMATLGEIEEAVETIRGAGDPPLCLLACTSAYPAPPGEMHLKRIPHLADTFDVPVGLSDHSLGPAAATASIALGASVIEKHFCISRDVENPDASFSMEPDEFETMVDQIRTVDRARGSITYGRTSSEESNRPLRRSIFAIQTISPGDVLTEDNIDVIRPGHGLEPKHYPALLGAEAMKEIRRGTPLGWSMVETTG